MVRMGWTYLTNTLAVEEEETRGEDGRGGRLSRLRCVNSGADGIGWKENQNGVWRVGKYRMPGMHAMKIWNRDDMTI